MLRSVYGAQPANLTTMPEFCSQLCVKVLQAPPLAPDSPIYMALSPPTPGTPQAFYAAYFSSAPAAQAFTPALQAPHAHASSAQWPQVRNNLWQSHVVSLHPSYQPYSSAHPCTGTAVAAGLLRWACTFCEAPAGCAAATNTKWYCTALRRMRNFAE